MKLVSSLLFVIVFLTACSSQPPQPEWLDKATGKYPADQFLTGLGEAGSREAAANRARAELAKTFQVAISDNSIDFSQAQSQMVDGVRVNNNQQKASRFVSAEARQVLEGVDIAEYWADPQGKFFALATLNKSAAAARFRDSIQRADRRTEELVSFADSGAKTAVATLRSLEQARQLQQQRNNSNRSLSVVAHKVNAARHTEAELEATIRKRLALLSFAVSSPEGRLDRELENAVAALGVGLDKDSQYKLTAVLDSGGVEQKQRWFWLRGSMALALDWRDETIAKQRWPYKVSAQDEAMVEQRAKDWVNDGLTEKLYQLLTAVAAK